MTVALSLNNSNSIQQKNRWDTSMQFPKTPVSKLSKQLITKKEGKILYLPSLIDTKTELFNGKISPTTTYKIQVGECVLEKEKTLENLLNSYIKVIDKIFFWINSVLWVIASLFIIVPLIFTSMNKISTYEFLFSTLLGFSFGFIMTKISKETKEKVVLACRQKIHQ